MEDHERLEKEIEQMIGHLYNVERVLRVKHANKVGVEHELMNISGSVADSARKIDAILNKTDFFDENEEELEEKLKSLEAEDRKSQSHFEQIKANAEKLQETLQASLEQVSNVKFGEGKNASLDNLF